MADNDNDLIARLRQERIEPERPIKPAPLAQIRSTRRGGISVRVAVAAAAAATLAVIAGIVVLVQQDDHDPTPAAPSPAPTSANEPGTGDSGSSPGPSRPCAIDKPATGESVVKVYFICQKTTLPAATYRVVDGGPNGQLRAALEAYFAGPTKDERRAGLIAPIGRSLAGTPTDITVDKNTAEVSFSDLGTLQTMAPTQRDFFVDSLAKTVRDIDGIRRLQLTLNGDCAQFWSTAAESKCLPIS